MTGPFRDSGEVEALAAEVVASVPLSGLGPDGLVRDHLQGTAATWTEGEHPGQLTLAVTKRHLTYTVAIDELVFEAQVDTGAIATRGELVVTLWYRLRATAKQTDARLAQALAFDVARAFLRAGIPGATLVPSRLRRVAQPVGEFLPVELRFVVGFDVIL